MKSAKLIKAVTKERDEIKTALLALKVGHQI